MATFKLGLDEDNFYKQVYLEYGKTRKDVQEYVDMLIKWAEEQPHFPEIPSINCTTFAIVACKFSIEKAKQKLDMYYTIRRLMPEIYGTHPLSPEMILHSKVMICVLLPKPTSNNQRVIYAQINPNYAPEDFSHTQFLIQLTHLIEVIIQEDKCFNFHMIFDCKGAKLGHAPKFSPMVLKKMSVCLEKVYSNRVASVYLVNFYSFMENLLNTVFKPLLPAKIRDRMKTCNGTDILFEAFDKSILPKDIGGEEKSLEELRVMMLNKFEEWKPRFDKIQFMTVDESLRPSKLENDDILGYYGSFKQISVD